MELKWFFVLVGIIFTFAIIMSNFFMISYISMQSQKNSDVQVFQANNHYMKLVNQSHSQALQQLDNHQHMITQVKDNLDTYANQVNTTVNEIKSILLRLNSTS